MKIIDPDYYQMYCQGYDAARLGLHPADCPFDEDMESTRDAWKHGWSDQILGKPKIDKDAA